MFFLTLLATAFRGLICWRGGGFRSPDPQKLILGYTNYNKFGTSNISLCSKVCVISIFHCRMRHHNLTFTPGNLPNFKENQIVCLETCFTAQNNTPLHISLVFKYSSLRFSSLRFILGYTNHSEICSR